MTESTISKRLGLAVSHYDSKLFSHCASCMWLSHLKVTQKQTPSGPFDQRCWTKVECGSHSHTRESEISSVEWQLKSWDSHLIGVCRCFFSFSETVHQLDNPWRHSDWTSPVHMVACTWLELFPPSRCCTSCRCPWLGWSPLAAAGWWWSSLWSYSGWQERIHAAPITVCCTLSQ